MIGKIISHYKILEKIGEGGMGVIYKAQDTKLKRMVALKFLPPELTRDSEAKLRFMQEAQTASALEHNNICNIHEIDETDDGRTFISMAYYEGETLKERIEREPLTVDEAINIAIQIAEGLAKAHSKNIIHRDIKPGNIFITKDGVVKILDFGLAKLKGQGKLTKTGTTIGTVAYMSPEQARGKDVDNRSDIWSLGVVLYEMLTGQLPFKGAYDLVIIYSVLNEEPPLLSNYSKEIPSSLQLIIEKTLDKEVSGRHQMVEDLLVDLKASKSLTGPVRIPFSRRIRKIKRFTKNPVFYTIVLIAVIIAGIFYFSYFEKYPIPIAVIPFLAEGLSEEEQGEILGLWHEVFDDFSRTSRLNNLTKDIVKEYSGTEDDLYLLKDRYKRAYAINTSVEWRNDEYYFSVRLIKLKDFSDDWVHSFNSSLLGFKQEYVSRIYGAMGLPIEPNHEQDLEKSPTQSNEAYAYYLRGQADLDNLEKLDHAMQMFNKALEQDSTFVLAYVGRAQVSALTFDSGRSNDAALLKNWRAEATKALHIDNKCVEAYGLLVFLDMYEGKMRESYKRAQETLDLNPHNFFARLALLHIYRTWSLDDLYKELCEESLEIDPLNKYYNINKGMMLCQEGRIDEGMKVFEETLIIYPDDLYLLFFKTWGNILQEKLEIARPIFQVAKDGNPDNKWLQLLEALLLAAEGDQVGAKGLITPEIIKYVEVGLLRAQWMPRIYAQHNDIDKAIVWLERLIDSGWEDYIWLRADPLMDNVRDDPRFQEIMKNLEVRWLKYKKEFK